MAIRWSDSRCSRGFRETTSNSVFFAMLAKIRRQSLFQCGRIWITTGAKKWLMRLFRYLQRRVLEAQWRKIKESVLISVFYRLDLTSHAREDESKDP